MQANSFSSYFNVGNNDDQATSHRSSTVGKPDRTLRRADGIVVKTLLSRRSRSRTRNRLWLVITADFYRKFLATNTGFEKTPINARDERNFLRVLKEQFSKALEPYKTPSNTYPFDEEIANSVFIVLRTEERNSTHLYKYNEFNLQHIKQLLQYRARQEELKKRGNWNHTHRQTDSAGAGSPSQGIRGHCRKSLKWFESCKPSLTPITKKGKRIIASGRKWR